MINADRQARLEEKSNFPDPIFGAMGNSELRGSSASVAAQMVSKKPTSCKSVVVVKAVFGLILLLAVLGALRSEHNISLHTAKPRRAFQALVLESTLRLHGPQQQHVQVVADFVAGKVLLLS